MEEEVVGVNYSGGVCFTEGERGADRWEADTFLSFIQKDGSYNKA